MGHPGKKRPFAQFRQFADNAIERSEHFQSIRDVVQHIGYSRGIEAGWSETGQCPEAAIWAVKGLLRELPNGEQRIEFTRDELAEIVAVLPTDNPLLIQKAIRAMRQDERSVA